MNSCTIFQKIQTCAIITVVPLIGISPLLTQTYQLNESVRMFSNKLRGNPLFIYSPGFVENIEDKKKILSCDFMRPILERWKDVDFAIVGIGREQQRTEIRQYKAMAKIYCRKSKTIRILLSVTFVRCI